MNTKAKGKVNLVALIISMLTVGLFVSFLTFMIISLGGNYDISGFEEEDLSKFNYNDNLVNDIEDAKDVVEDVTVDPNLFDYLAGLFKNVLGGLKAIYRSFTVLVDIVDNILSNFQLPHIFQEYFYAVIIIIVVIGIIMIKFYLNKQGG